MPLVNVISPHDLTTTAMTETFVRIHLYAKANQKLPPGLADLPVRERYVNCIQDGWENELVYKVSEAGVVTLTSLGSDRKVGGVGDASDVKRSCSAVDKDGRFIAGEDGWTLGAVR